MAGMCEACSVCGRQFEMQFRYQMEERDGAFSFFCSQKCHAASLRGDTGAVVCDACHKSFRVELALQVLHVKGARRYACAEVCRAQLLAESEGVRLGELSPPRAVIPPESEKELPPVLRPSSAAPPPPALRGAPRASVRSLAPPLPPRGFSMAGPRRLAVFNHKGGTGKTTTSVNLAAGLARHGARVLLVDTDSQGNVGVSLGIKSERSLYHVLVMGLRARDAAVNVRPGFDVLPSNETLAAAELYLAGRQNRDRVLRDRLANVADDYDVVILDCSPSLSLLNQNALVFAEGIVVPVACDFLSLVGVRQVIKTVKSVNSLLHHAVQIYGVLPTFYDGRARICRDAVETLQKHFGDRCLPPIRMATKIKEAPAQGKTIFEHAPDSHAAEDYERTARALIEGPASSRHHPEERAAASA